MDLIQARSSMSDEEEIANMIMNNSNSQGEEDEFEIDEFTRKRLPRIQDFIVKDDTIKPKKLN